MSLALLQPIANAKVSYQEISLVWRRLLVASVILSLAIVQTTLLHKPGELPVYLKAATNMLAGEPIYRTDEGPAFTYPPCFALPFIPLALLPPAAADFVWNAANLAQAWFVLLLLERVLRTLSLEATSWQTCSVISCALSARFLICPLEYRSHDFMVALLLFGALLTSVKSRDGWTGAMLGLATACKATPLVFLPMLMMQRRFKAAGVFAVVCAATLFLPDLLFPAKAGGPWVGQWYRVFVSKVDAAGPAVAGGAWRAWNPLNQSLSGTFYRFTSACETPEFAAYDITLVPLSSTVKQVATLSALAGIYLASLYCCWRAGRARRNASHRAWNDVAIWSVLIAESLLLSPMTSKTHFAPLALAIALLVLVSIKLRHRNPALVVGLAVLFILGTLLAKDVVGRHWGNWAAIAGSFTWCAAICWGLSAYVVLRGERMQLGADVT